jgi:hypothetical protein
MKSYHSRLLQQMEVDRFFNSLIFICLVQGCSKKSTALPHKKVIRMDHK